MINTHNAKYFCNEDISNIENYEEAIKSDKLYLCHHRLETHFSNGTPRPANAQLVSEELEALGMYSKRPASELIFLTRSEHAKIHNIRPKSDEWKRKQSEAKKGHEVSDETKAKISDKAKEQWTNGNAVPPPSHKGMHWKLVNGKRTYFS